jgi:hypothetical protein
MGTTGDGRKETFAATARIAEVVGGDVNRETRYSTLRVTERWHRRETPELERCRGILEPALSSVFGSATHGGLDGQTPYERLRQEITTPAA